MHWITFRTGYQVNSTQRFQSLYPQHSPKILKILFLFMHICFSEIYHAFVRAFHRPKAIVETLKYRTCFREKSPDLIKSFELHMIQPFRPGRKYWSWFAIWMIHTYRLFRQYFSSFRKIIHRRHQAVHCLSTKWVQHNSWTMFRKFSLPECWKCQRSIRYLTFWTHGKCQFVKHARQTTIQTQYLPQALLWAFKQMKFVSSTFYFVLHVLFFIFLCSTNINYIPIPSKE